jgi:predicted deacetylase
MTPRAMISVHDVMPETLGRVREILSLLEGAGVPPATLLVVPGKPWSRREIRCLRSLAERGHPLAGHGWVHKAPAGARTFYHRFHGRLISRDEAEHLSRPRAELSKLIQRCHAWFPSAGLPEPSLYVPPAWALGALALSDLTALPFRRYEVLRGFLDVRSRRFRWLPLAGFEADTTFRKVGLRLWNGLNRTVSRRLGIPLRISIHPGDLKLLLREDLRRMVSTPWTFVGEDQIMCGAEAPGTP